MIAALAGKSIGVEAGGDGRGQPEAESMCAFGPFRGFGRATNGQRKMLWDGDIPSSSTRVHVGLAHRASTENGHTAIQDLGQCRQFRCYRGERSRVQYVSIAFKQEN